MTATTCITCGRIIPVGSGGRCSAHRAPARRTRSTAAWTALSREVRARGRCELCRAVLPPWALEADHRIPASVRPDLALDPRNVRALCRPCHRSRAREIRPGRRT